MEQSERHMGRWMTAKISHKKSDELWTGCALKSRLHWLDVLCGLSSVCDQGSDCYTFFLFRSILWSWLDSSAAGINCFSEGRERAEWKLFDGWKCAANTHIFFRFQKQQKDMEQWRGPKSSKWEGQHRRGGAGPKRKAQLGARSGGHRLKWPGSMTCLPSKCSEIRKKKKRRWNKRSLGCGYTKCSTVPSVRRTFRLSNFLDFLAAYCHVSKHLQVDTFGIFRSRDMWTGLWRMTRHQALDYKLNVGKHTSFIEWRGQWLFQRWKEFFWKIRSHTENMRILVLKGWPSRPMFFV